MRRITTTTLGLGMALVLVGACTSDPESTIDPPSADDGGDNVTRGEIIVTGDLSAGTAADSDTSSDIDSDATTPDDSSDTESERSSTTTSTPATTTRPTTSTATAGNDSTASTSPPTTEDEVIGDGPVLTPPPGIDDSGESPGVQTGLTPVFFALEANTTVECADADPGTVRLRWEVIGTETVDISVGSVGAIRSADQPPAGSMDLPLDCTNGSQYFVIAENPDGETIRSVSVGLG